MEREEQDQFPVAKITGLTGAEGSGRLGPTRTARGVGWGASREKDRR